MLIKSKINAENKRTAVGVTKYFKQFISTHYFDQATLLPETYLILNIKKTFPPAISFSIFVERNKMRLRILILRFV